MGRQDREERAMTDEEFEVRKAEIERRRWFGLGSLVLAVFCAGVAAVSWRGKGAVDVAMWLGFAAVELLIGAWQLDKAGKEKIELARKGRGG